ncbi:MAG: universal stress protein [Betaproteobacteria bacterium]|nr:universal stress protein [Betaproteobacteria bacterium]
MVTPSKQLTGDAAIPSWRHCANLRLRWNPVATIAAEADALDAHLVVLGARGESLPRHALAGSTAAPACARRRDRCWW